MHRQSCPVADLVRRTSLACDFRWILSSSVRVIVHQVVGQHAAYWCHSGGPGEAVQTDDTVSRWSRRSLRQRTFVHVCHAVFVLPQPYQRGVMVMVSTNRSLGQNRLSGSIPSSMAAMRSLVSVWVQQCRNTLASYEQQFSAQAGHHGTSHYRHPCVPEPANFRRTACLGASRRD